MEAGSSLGLWLGLSVVGLFDIGVFLTAKFRKYYNVFHSTTVWWFFFKSDKLWAARRSQIFGFIVPAFHFLCSTWISQKPQVIGWVFPTWASLTLGSFFLPSLKHFTMFFIVQQFDDFFSTEINHLKISDLCGGFLLWGSLMLGSFPMPSLKCCSMFFIVHDLTKLRKASNIWLLAWSFWFWDALMLGSYSSKFKTSCNIFKLQQFDYLWSTGVKLKQWLIIIIKPDF